ncbi:hypothetical protein OS188_14445 [Xanthomarina sp. F1114]|uniref:hypothetical protein n=1 Tax=Xanthomarina sp. F1114 TaxID=2996019 RepID=UPI00225E1BF5|nr:hypothetical protein [Xanthomarina sp. F1114]MCX7549154.1 hypothetical protein [Xanthomarina sp. F1114]
MKKSIYIANFLLILLAFSCGQNSAEKELNGKWYEIKNDGITRLFFKPDSLIITDLRKQTVEWSADESKIEFNYHLMFPDSLGRKLNKTTLKYNLSPSKDTLFTTIVDPQKEMEFNLIRASNYIDYLNKKSGIKFELPKIDNVEPINLDSDYALKIFMGFSKNKLIAKTELSNNLNKLEADIRTFKDNIKTSRPEQAIIDEFRFHLRVFADKEIPDSIITENLPATVKSDFFKIYDFPRPPNDTVPIKIYRIYKSEEAENLGYMKGKKIKTIANNVYN